jgi:hypothetical protein
MIRQGSVRARARVGARTFKGEGIKLMATIHGADRREEAVLFVAQTSAGTKPCANCASVVGLSFDEMAELMAGMHRDEARTNWETLRILADELWNFADGRRTLGEVADAICFEFGVEIHPRHFFTLARGPQKAGVFTLQSVDR